MRSLVAEVANVFDLVNRPSLDQQTVRTFGLPCYLERPKVVAASATTNGNKLRNRRPLRCSACSSETL